MPEQIKIGANKLVSLPLKDADGNYLNPDDLSLIKVQIIQYHRTIAEYTLGVDPELRETDSPDTLELEVTKALSLKFKETQDENGYIYSKLVLEMVDSEFLVDGEFRDMPEVVILEAVL